MLIISCKNHEKFDKVKWQQKNESGNYPYRESMLKDLMHQRLKGRSYNEVIALIGIPENNQNKKDKNLYYNLAKKYDGHNEPYYIKNLSIKISSDGTVREVGIQVIEHD